jgi:hypothetical protein
MSVWLWPIFSPTLSPSGNEGHALYQNDPTFATRLLRAMRQVAEETGMRHCAGGDSMNGVTERRWRGDAEYIQKC